MYLAYLTSLLRHKWFVFRAGLIVGGVPLWRLIVHDWQKFTRWEFDAYASYNFGGENTQEAQDTFNVAWLHHENTAPHHWGYWIARSGGHAGRPFDMPETYCHEMVADWMGAEMAYGGSFDMSKWLSKNFHPNAQRPIVVSDKTRAIVDDILIGLGYTDTGDEYVYEAVSA